MNTTTQTLKFYWRHASRYPLILAGLFLSIPATVAASTFIPPLIIADILNRLGSHSYNPNDLWGSFGTSLIVYAAVIIASGSIGWRVVDTLAWSMEGKVERDIARRVFSHLMSQSPAFHANRFSGSLVSHTNKLMGSYIRFADTSVFNVIPLLWGLVFAGIILSQHSPLYAVILIVFAAIYMVSSVFVTAPARRIAAKQAAAESAQTGNLADSVTNIMAIKSFAGQAYEEHRFSTATDRTRRQLMQLMRVTQVQQIYFSLMANGMQGLSLVIAVIGAAKFHADLASVFLIASYTGSIASNLFQFSNNALRNYNRSFGDAADMVAVLAIEPEIKDVKQPEAPHINRGEIVFDGVTFAHDGSNDALFKNLNVKIKAGEKVGLVGHSGSGKTTFTRLLLRFSDVQGGRIVIDGQNISKLRQDDLRRHVAYVPQESILFHRSLRENIGYGNPDATDEEIEAIAKLAHAHDFIAVLPEGYNTLVGERGIKLSGGQRQRIAIARAMLKNAPILVLDEATASLDSESEALIQDALWKLMQGRTAIVVAHRLSTIQKMDRIIVMDDGKIIEQGTHKELLRKGGQYANLWARQSGGFIEE